VEIHPATANTGITFQRTDLAHKPYIPAKANNVIDTQLSTKIGTEDDYVSTIEHLMAAFYGFGIDNALVTIDSWEMPILDGSALPFLALLDEAGIEELELSKKVFIVKKTIEVVDKKDPTRFVRIEPHGSPLLSYAIDFPGIGSQKLSLDMNGYAFCRELCFARTFCLKEDIDIMQSLGFGKGGSLDNAVVFSKKTGKVLNPNGLRHELEFVKHKALDCIGDLALVGNAIVGHVICNKAGHELHTALANKLLEAQASSALDCVDSLSPSLKEQMSQVLTFPMSLGNVKESFKSFLTQPI
jgi:UDP-3-O-[3-hydroxymyristoyl] N-acetylglucosamine deacetylase